MGITWFDLALRGWARICWRSARTWTAPKRLGSIRRAARWPRWRSRRSSPGLARRLHGLYFRYIDPDAVFSIAMSVEMVFIAVVGGIATTGGPIVGAVFLGDDF